MQRGWAMIVASSEKSVFSEDTITGLIC